MRLLADQDVYAITIALLRVSGHDVLTAAELGLSRADDIHLLQESIGARRIFVTRDRDFGGLIFVNSVEAGVIYLRMALATMGAVHDELMRVLNEYTEDELLNAFVVVEPARHRIRRRHAS
jgi:predicted nuclease of predicted toxin-antitoxin system